MVKREELLAVVECDSEADIIAFVKTCKSDGDDCLSETLASCSRKQLDTIWSKIHATFSATLTATSKETDLESDQESASDNHVADVVPSLVAMVSGMLCQEEVYIPTSMFETALLMQASIPNLPETADKLKNSVARVFEDWWRKGVQGREQLIVTSLVFILERSLDLQPKPLIADVKRVWSLHEVLSLIDMKDEDSGDMKDLLQRCFISPLYMNNKEGHRFLGCVFSLDEEFTDVLHRTIKNHLLTVPKSWHQQYGEVYFRAWQGLSPGPQLLRLEEKCLQDWMYHAAHAQPQLFPALKKLLGYIHKQKKQRGVGEMLFRLYEPIMWRSLKVASSQVRSNTATLFFDVFPLENPDMNVRDADQLLQKQFDLFQELLNDPFPKIRVLSVFGVTKVMLDFWDVIPEKTLKNLTVKLIQGMLVDANSADVRESVVKGLTRLLDNPVSHLFLKPILPEIRNSFHDVSEKVRIAMLELLIKVKSLRTIKYWLVVPMEHLLARLAVDSDPVNRRIMKLILPSFIPAEAPSDVQLDRCITLIKSNPTAARQVFRYAPRTMNLEDVVNYMSMLCRSILIAIKHSSTNNSLDSGHGTEDSHGNEQEEVDNDCNDDNLKISNTPVVLGLLEAVCIMWTISDDVLQKSSNANLKKGLQKKFSYAIPEMLKTFSDPRISCVLVQIAAFLPAAYIPTVSRTWVPKLRNMTGDNVEDDYSVILESLLVAGRASDVMELTTDWLKPYLVKQRENSTPSAAKTTKKAKKKVGFIDPTAPQPKLAIDFLLFLFRHPNTQNILLRDHLPLCVEVRDLLQQSTTVIQDRLAGCEDGRYTETATDSVLQSAFTLCCKIHILLHSTNKTEYDCVPELLNLLSWTDKHVLPAFSVKDEDIGETNRKRGPHTSNKELAVGVIESMLAVFNNMLLVGIGNRAMSTELIDFCTACLALDDQLRLLSTVMLCLYQMTEFIKYNNETDGDTSCHGGAISNALSRVFVSVAAYVKQHPGQSLKLLGSVKGHLLELMKAVFQSLSLDADILHDVMATIVATIMAELMFYSQQFDLEDIADPATLPPLSSWLLDILQKRAAILKFFVEEMTDCLESGAITDIHNMHGAVHLTTALCKCKHSVEGLKELWTAVYKETEKHIGQQTDGDGQEDTNKEVITAIQAKMKDSQTCLKMVPPEPPYGEMVPLLP